MTTYTQKRAAGTPCWFDLMSSDPPAAREFYSKLFGWEFDVMGPEYGYYSMAKLGNSYTAGLGGVPPGVQMPSAWTVYMASDNVDTDANRIKELGGQLLTEVMTIGNQGRMVMGVDPTGAAFGLWESGEHFGSGLSDVPGSMVWAEVATRDSAKARDFYCALLNATAELMTGMVYYMLKKGEPAVAGVMQMDENFPAMIPAHWMPYFAVEDIEAATKRAEASGGRVQVPPFDSPYGHICVLIDPQGAVFSIIKLK
jgi:hypothetical protein